MKPSIRRTLLGLLATVVVVGSLTACGGRGGHAHGWSDERITEAQTKVVERVSRTLELDATQRQKLSVLADEVVASRKAVRGTTDPRTDLQALLAGETFDRSKAQALLDQKTQAVQGSGPKLIQAFGDFYDSLNPAQQQQVRDRLAKRRYGAWGRS